MIEAGILGTIQSSAVPIRALYSRNIREMDFFDNLPACPDIRLDENQYRIIAQKVKERNRQRELLHEHGFCQFRQKKRQLFFAINQ